MSVPAITHMTCIAVMQRVESYVLSLSNFFFASRYITPIILLNHIKAVLPASYARAGNISAGTYKYYLTFSRRPG